MCAADENQHWRPEGFSYELWGCEVGIRFPVEKLMDYRPRWEALERERNPFAVVVMAHLKARDTRWDADERYCWKLRLIRSLYARGYSREDVIELFRFIDWVMSLPDEMESSLWTELSRYEEEKHMPYVTSVERIGRKIGRAEGLQHGMRQMLIKQLVRRFGQLPDWAEKRVDSAAPEDLEQWAERVLDARDLEEVFAVLRSDSGS